MIGIEDIIALISAGFVWFFTYQHAMKVKEERKNIKLKNKKLELEIKKNRREGL